MKVVLLAAGRSVRMKPLTDKNFLKFLGRPLILHQIEALAKASFNEILVIGGAHNLQKLRGLLKESGAGFKKIKITLKEQENLELGMAGAVISAEKWIKNDPFLVVSANDVVDFEVFSLMRKAINKGEGLLLAKKVGEYFPGGYLAVNGKKQISKIVEKPGEGNEPSEYINIVVHYHPFPKELINGLKKISSDRDDRYERALQSLFDSGINYRAVDYDGFWQAVKYPWHVLALMNKFLAGAKSGAKKRNNKASIAKTAVIKGEVVLEEGVKVLDNAVIQGPAYIGKNTVIATNALVRQSHIGENCVIGFGSEIARSFIGDCVWTHTNYVGDSVIGNNVSFGSGAVIGNLRLDEKNISVDVNGDRIDTGLNKIGVIMGDNIRVGINTSFMPGIKIGSDSFIGAGIVIATDVPEKSYVTGDWKLKIKENKEKIGTRGI